VGRFLLVLAAALATAAAAAGAVGGTQVSSNWSGYVATTPTGAPPLSFTDATRSWRIPKITCSKAGTSSAYRVGIGGSSETSPALEQLGTSADCGTSRVTTYRAWTEIIPAPPRYVSLRVRAGDLITAALLIDGQTIVMNLENQTRGTHYSTRVAAQQQLDTSSAEWIAEAPSICRSQTACDVVPLSNFGTVGFRNVAATANGHAGVLTDPLWLVSPVALVASNGAARYTASSNSSGAVPNPITGNGRGFSVTYRATFRGNVPAAPLPGAPLPAFVH
jgi:hypothetical protein